MPAKRTTAKKTTAKTTRKTTRKRRGPAEARGPEPQQSAIASDDAEIGELVAHIRSSRGAVIGAYRDPYGGTPLVFAFAREFLPDEFNEVRRMFDRRGAYARFKDLLQRRKALDRWYDFETRATEAALREWCEINGITIEPSATPASEPDQR